MSYDVGFNFRGDDTSAGFADIESSGQVYVLAGAYPVSRVPAGQASPVAFGYVSRADGASPAAGISPRNRNSGTPYAPELAGVNFITNGSTTKAFFRVDLPAPGAYDLTIAMGDASNPGIQYGWVYDGNQSPGWASPLLTIASNLSTTAGSFVDVNGSVRTGTQWQAERSSKRVNLATSTLYVAFGGGSNLLTESSTIAHLRVQQVSSGPTGTLWLSASGGYLPIKVG